MAPRELFLFFLIDTSSGKSYYYVDTTDHIKSSSQPLWLNDAPDGWLQAEVSFGRSAKYYGINRSFGIPLKFAGDGARIIRHHLYSGKGIEAPLTLLIAKWDESDDTYKLYYKGELDLSKVDDTAAEMIQVNLIEGGITKLLKAYENTTFEIPCDGSIPENFQVLLDGCTFKDTFTYQVNQYTLGRSAALSMAFISNVGDNIGIEKGGQFYEEFAPGTNMAQYAAGSTNTFFETASPVTLTIQGTIGVKCLLNTFNKRGIIAFETSKGAEYNLFIENIPAGAERTLPFNFTIPLSAGEKLFLLTDIDTNIILEISEFTFTVDFLSRFKETTAWCMTAYDVFVYLVNKIGDGKYAAQSNLLKGLKNLVLTSGTSLRGDPAAVIKTTISDFFTTFNALLGGALSNYTTAAGDTLFFEKKKFVFDDSVVTLDLGEVEGLKTSVPNDYFFNDLTIGWPDQSYDEKAGQMEYNAVSKFKSPITRIVKELDLTAKYRADSIGIELTRFLFGGKSTTNNGSDNSVFVLDVQEKVVGSFVANLFIDNNPSNYISITDASGLLINSFTKGTRFALSGTSNNNKTFTVASVVAGVGSFNVFVNEAVTVEVANGATVSLTGFVLFRETYSSTTGLVDATTAYNLRLRPKFMVANNGDFFRSTLFNLLPGALTFQSSSKSKDVSTTLNGVSVIDKTDVPISSLAAPLFYPFVFEFKTKVPLNFNSVMSGAANGHVKFRFNGKVLYGFPVQVSQRPGLDESQTWKLLCSTKTTLSDLEDIDIDGLNYFDLMGYQTFIPHLCPLQLVPLGLVQPAQYHQVHMDADWFKNQVKRWAHQKEYFQPWQTNDIIPIQCQTNGLGNVQAQLIDSSGKVISTVSLPNVNAAAIKLPRILFENDVNLSGLAEGLYYVVLSAGSAGTMTQFISEPLYIKADWPGTLLFEYSHSRNKQSTIFSTGWSGRLRVHGWIDTYTPQGKFAVYEDQPADLEMLNGIPFRTFRLNIGYDDGVPDWVIDKINRIMLLDSVLIDGVAYTRNGDAKFEVTSFPGNPKRYWTLEIREAHSKEGITLNTDGQLDQNITVVYNINTIGFGDGPNGGVVQVPKTQ